MMTLGRQLPTPAILRLQANLFEAGEPVEAESGQAEGGTDATSRKRKRSQGELIQVYEASENDLNVALTEFRDEMLGGAGVYHTLSAERKASVDKAVNSMRWKAYKVFQKSKVKKSASGQRFDQTWVNPVDYSGFESSQEPDDQLADPTVYEAGDEVLATLNPDEPRFVLSQDPDSEEIVVHSTQKHGGGRPPTSLLNLQGQERNKRIAPYLKVLLEWEAKEAKAKGPKVSAVQLCGLFIHALCYHTTKDADGNILTMANRDLSKVGLRIFKGEEVMPLHKVSLLEAVFIQDVLKVNTSSYRGLKFLLEKMIWFPGVNAVGDFKRVNFRPELWRDVVPDEEVH